VTAHIQTILSYGMGVESTAILLRWIFEPETLPCPLEDLIVITSQVGDEYADTKRDVDAHIIPLMRKHRIRYVQVARGGHLESDGICLLEDSREPSECFTDGAYKLSDELKLNGTVPQYGGVHRCALKFKAWVIERWLAENIRGQAKHAIGYNAEEERRIAKSEYAFETRIAFGFNSDETDRVTRAGEYDGLRGAGPAAVPPQERIAFGYNADEGQRVAKNCEYNTFTRTAFYPLMEWGWTRQDCLDYIFKMIAVHWRKSACVYCPFNALKDEAIERHREHPKQVADAMTIEHMSLALNPRGSLYKGRTLIQITTTSNNWPAVAGYRRWLRQSDWAIYRVRRIYHASRKDPTKKGTADRSVEHVGHFTDLGAAILGLQELAAAELLDIEEHHGIRYAYRLRRGDIYPTREEFFVAAPATVNAKAAHGHAWFDARWNQTAQANLF